MAALRLIDLTDEPAFRLVPPCADPRFDHRTCDHWEDADRGSRRSRPEWLEAARPVPAAPSARTPDPANPFAPPAPAETWNPFAAPGGSPGFDPFADDDPVEPIDNPFAPTRSVERPRTTGLPRKLALLDRGRGVFGSYAKVLLEDEQPVGYVQFGPLSAYPRASRIRELYPQLPEAPLPAVITCIATTAEARRRGHAQRMVRSVCDELAERGFAAVETYPDLTQPPDATSAARPGFWEICGFHLAVDDDRFPVMRLELG